MKFTKLQGAGNDFIVVNGLVEKSENWNEVAKKACDRHFGIGADGFIFCSESDIADIKMNFYNSDGSRAEMCGNGIRCFSRYVYDNNIVKKKNIAVETDAGIKYVSVQCDNKGKVELLGVEMGQVDFATSLIPCNIDKDNVINEDIEVEGNKIKFSSVLMGVPHTIIFVEDYKNIDIDKIGSKLEKHSLFPKKTNVNFVKKIDERTLQIKTWERGAGRTLGCGTGSSAAAAVAKKIGLIKENEISLLNDGGELIITLLENNNIKLSGKAKVICSGEYVGEI